MNAILAKSTLLLVLLLGLSACPGGKAGWSQSDKDTLVNSCVKEAKASGAPIDETKLKNYCSCYQQNLEKKYPNINDLKTVKADEVAKSAESCLDLMLK